MKKRTIISVLLVAFMYCMPLISNAQPDPGGDPDAPIDGGLSILIAAGVSYVAKKGYDKRKKDRVVLKDKQDLG
jgi:hypothetical protein